MGLATQQVMALDSTANAALHLPPIAHECSTTINQFGPAEIFKKTPYAAGLKPGGRDVAKDMPEVDGIPLLMKTLLDHGTPQDDSLIVAGPTIAENLKTLKRNSHQGVVRSADKPVTVAGGVVGLKGNLVLQAAIGGPITLLEDGDIVGIDADDGDFDVKLTDEELVARQSKWKLHATNHTSGALWKYAQQVGPAVDGAVTHPGGAHEKQFYADI
jgi:dihydroxyacid dehydratase/phosphogluconate dehydratase